MAGSPEWIEPAKANWLKLGKADPKAKAGTTIVMVQTSNRAQNLDRTIGGAANRRHQELRGHWSQAPPAALQMHEWPNKTETELQLDQAKNIAATTHNEPPSPPLHPERANKWLLPRAPDQTNCPTLGGNNCTKSNVQWAMTQPMPSLQSSQR